MPVVLSAKEAQARLQDHALDILDYPDFPAQKSQLVFFPKLDSNLNDLLVAPRNQEEVRALDWASRCEMQHPPKGRPVTSS